MDLRASYRAFRRNQVGSITVWTGLTIVSLLGVAALGIDMNYLYTTKAQLQIAADAAASAAIKLLADQDEATAAAENYAELNMPAEVHGSVVGESAVEFGKWDSETREFTSGGTPVNAVRVVAQRSAANGNAAPTYFGNLLGKSAVDISVDAIAIVRGMPCILALDPSTDKAVEVNSNAQILTNECDIHVKSGSSSALYTDSNAVVAVTNGKICIEGGFTQQSASSITPDPKSGCNTIDDPMSSLSPPSVGACDHTEYEVDNGTVTLDPGVYCEGLIIKNNSNVTLNPGTYIIDELEFLVDSNSSLSGTGVLIYLSGGANINLNSNTSFNLSAPISGPYTGVLLIAEPGYNLTHVLDSNNFSNFDGLIYFPDDKLEANSNTQVSNGQNFTYLIAKTFYIDSNAELNVDPESSSVPTPPALAKGSRLVN